MKFLQFQFLQVSLLALCAAPLGCANKPSGPGPDCSTSAQLSPATSSTDLVNRAYIASRDSGEITVIDLNTLQVVGVSNPCGPGNHMVELSSDFSKAYVTAAETNTVNVFDTRTLGLVKQIPVAAEPTHLSLSRDGKLIAVVAEHDHAVSFIDAMKDIEIKRLPGFHTPHFVRFAPDGRFAYVANLGANHITRLDLSTLRIDGFIGMDNQQSPPHDDEVGEEGGFADVQIDGAGLLWGAHRASGRALVYDTVTQKKLPELELGPNPWIIYAEHPFAELRARTAPTWGNLSVALVSGGKEFVASTVETGESESYGVNYSPLVPEKAFVMNRKRREIAVLNTSTKTSEALIAVGGNTETASTTADGRYIVAAVSDANRVVVIDTRLNTIAKTFDGIGNYPWTVTIPLGQNYCH